MGEKGWWRVSLLLVAVLVILGGLFIFLFKNQGQLLFKVRIASSPTPIPEISVSPTVTPAVSEGLPVSIGGNLYLDQEVRKYLKPGDHILAVASRGAKGARTPVSREKFDTALSTLNGVDETETGVEKALMFSSYKDVQTYISQIPAAITWILYNMESAITPLEELQDPVGSGRIIADLAHQSGRKMGFGPTRDLFDRWEEDGRLAEILGYADRVTYQAQNFEDSRGLGLTEEQLIPFLGQKYGFIQKTNQANGKNTKFYVQLWYPQQQPQDMARIFNQLSNPRAVDYAGLGGVKKTEDVVAILKGLGR